MCGFHRGTVVVRCATFVTTSWKYGFSADTPKIQEGHLVIGHILCGLVENAMFKPSN